jgi:hypothetical protein
MLEYIANMLTAYVLDASACPVSWWNYTVATVLCFHVTTVATDAYYGGHRSTVVTVTFLNLAPRFRAIDPPDRPGLNLRLVVRVNNPICHQNEPKNVHYLPVVTPRMILQDAPDNDFQVLGPFARSCARPHCPSKVRERRQSAACDLGICGHMRFMATFDPGDTLRPLPGPEATIVWGSQIFQPLKRRTKLSTRPPGPVEAPGPPPSR